MDWAITRSAHAAMLAEAMRAAPHECCGLLWGDAIPPRVTHIEPTANVAAARGLDPARHFEIDPAALIAAHRAARAGRAHLLGYYHSHPAGPSEPSATDRAHAGGDNRVWAIIGKDGKIACWRDTPMRGESATGGGCFTALSTVTVDD